MTQRDIEIKNPDVLSADLLFAAITKKSMQRNVVVGGRWCPCVRHFRTISASQYPAALLSPFYLIFLCTVLFLVSLFDFSHTYPDKCLRGGGHSILATLFSAHLLNLVLYVLSTTGTNITSIDFRSIPSPFFSFFFFLLSFFFL